MAKRYWLLKCDPEVFSFDDLLKLPGKKTSWEGVRNYQARNLMRDEFQVGDEALFYHSRLEEPCITGTVEVVRAGYPDWTALDPKHRYFDPDSKKKGESPWVMVDVKATQKFKKPVTRTDLKKQATLRDMMVLKKGSRLSVQPVTAEEFKTVLKLGSLEPVR